MFVQIGLVPNTEWLKDSGLELSPHGEIVIDGQGRTNLPGVFAAGDATTVPYKQIVVAMGEGSKAALSAFDYLIRTEPLEDSKRPEALNSSRSSAVSLNKSAINRLDASLRSAPSRFHNAPAEGANARGERDDGRQDRIDRGRLPGAP